MTFFLEYVHGENIINYFNLKRFVGLEIKIYKKLN